MEKPAALNTGTAMLQPGSQKRSRRLQHILGPDWQIALPFVLPVIIIMTAFIFWPFINAILLSFTTRNLATRSEVYVGLKNYINLASDTDFLGAVSNTIIFTVYSVAFKFVIGMLVALTLNSRLPFRSILTGIILLPWIVPEVVTALTWRNIYDPIFGGLNPILMQLGLINHAVGWLSEPSLAMPSVIAVNIWKGIPFYIILLLAGLKAIDREQHEAAEVDGAGPIQRFRHITLPGLRYVIMVTVLLSAISTFNTFGLVYLMTGGGPGGATRLFSILAYEKAIIGLRFGPGVATAFSVAPVLAVFIFVLARFMRQDHYIQEISRNTFMDRLTAGLGRGVSALLDLFFFPFQWVYEQAGRLSNALFGIDPKALPNRAQRERRGLIFRLAILVPVLIFVLFPFYWIIITSFKSDLQIQTFNSLFWPNPWTTEQFQTLLSKTSFLIWFRNTVIVATGSTVISVSLAAMAA
jgi:multiple sugar transport system permease protein